MPVGSFTRWVRASWRKGGADRGVSAAEWCADPIHCQTHSVSSRTVVLRDDFHVQTRVGADGVLLRASIRRCGRAMRCARRRVHPAASVVPAANFALKVAAKRRDFGCGRFLCFHRSPSQTDNADTSLGWPSLACQLSRARAARSRLAADATRTRRSLSVAIPRIDKPRRPAIRPLFHKAARQG